MARQTTTTRRFGKAAVAAVRVAAALTAGNVLLHLGSPPGQTRLGGRGSRTAAPRPHDGALRA